MQGPINKRIVWRPGKLHLTPRRYAPPVYFIHSYAGFPLEALAALARFGLSPMESLTGIGPYEPAPMDSKGSNVFNVAGSDALPFESLTSIGKTWDVPFEALEGLKSGSALPAESLEAMGSKAGNPMESKTSEAAGASLPMESKAGVGGRAGLSAETLGSLAGSTRLPADSLLTLRSLVERLPMEVLAAVVLQDRMLADATGAHVNTTYGGLPIESTSAISRVSVGLLDIVGSLIGQGRALLDTNKSMLAWQAHGPVESLTGIGGDGGLPAEALVRLLRLAGQPMETTGNQVWRTELPMELLTGLKPGAVAGADSKASMGVGESLPGESQTSLHRLTGAPFDVAQTLYVVLGQSGLPVESLARPTSHTSAPAEVLQFSISEVAFASLPIETITLFRMELAALLESLNVGGLTQGRIYYVRSTASLATIIELDFLAESAGLRH